MGLRQVTSGSNVPDIINVIVEIPAHSEPIKYEVDKESGAIFVDRFMATSMRYPCDYGYIPHTLSEDGDPVDVLMVTPMPLTRGSVLQCRPVGMLRMSDESGEDAKILAVPIDDITPIYKDVQVPEDLPPLLLNQIGHFFNHYKDLEEGKWVKLQGWVGVEEAKKEIMDSIRRFDNEPDQPAF